VKVKGRWTYLYRAVDTRVANCTSAQSAFGIG
jgi:transposase-like protein